MGDPGFKQMFDYKIMLFYTIVKHFWRWEFLPIGDTGSFKSIAREHLNIIVYLLLLITERVLYTIDYK